MTDIIDPPSLEMMKEARQWLEVVLGLPDGERRFQDALIATERAESSFEMLMTMASAALLVANNAPDVSSLWFRERAEVLICKAYDVIASERAQRVAMAEATLQRPVTGLN